MTFKLFSLYEFLPFVKNLAMNRKDFSVHYEEQYNSDIDCMVSVYVVIVHNKLC